MKKSTLLLFLLLLSCRSFALPPGKPVVQPEVILKNYDNFFQYVTAHMRLSQDLLAYDTKGKQIAKAAFLTMLTSGNYLPVKLTAESKVLQYQLHRLTAAQAKEMGQYLSGWSREVADHYQYEGRQFPKVDLTDIKGNRYTTANTRGKVLVVNCWFIGCANCEKEMPALNELMSKYHNRKDVVFIALALDSKPKVEAFLKRKPFSYNQIASQRAYLTQTLKVTGYPTHYVVNKQGKIVSVVDTPQEVIYALNNRL